MWFRICAECGRSLEPEREHSVVTDRTDGFSLFAFCGMECEAEWRERKRRVK
jgi:hypothetical protein